MKLPTQPAATRAITLLAALSAASLLTTAHAADLYWGGWDGVVTTAAWATAGNWYTDAGETIASGAAPTASDDLFFNTTTDNALGGTITLSGNIAVDSITYNTSAATTISQNGATKSLTLGSGGITVNSGAGAATFGASSAALNVEITADQTWTNNSTNILTVRSPSVSNTATGDTQLTVNAASSGGISLTLGVKDSIDTLKALTLVIDSAGTGTVSTVNASTHTGGTFINRGIFSTRAAMGTGDITIGVTNSANNAQLRATNSVTLDNNIVVQSGTGTRLIGADSAAVAPTPTFTGDILLNKDLSVGSFGTANTAPVITISGDISGAGGLTLTRIDTGTRDASLILSGTNTYSGNTTIARLASAFTLADTGTMTFYVGANGVNNSISGAGGSATFNGTFAFDLSGASQVDGNSWTLVNTGTLAESFTGTFAVTGFTEAGNVWTNGTGFSFAEATGILSFTAVPEPSTYALLGGAGALLLAAVRRRRGIRAPRTS